MSRIARLAALTLALAGASSALGACQAIAGIEERSYVPVATGGGAGAAGAGSDVPPSPQCLAYCAQAKEVCGEGILYRTDGACLKTCARMPLEGNDKNSVACRVHQLDNAVQTNESLDLYCASAGPGGNGACGSNCENLCHLLASTCSNEFKKYTTAAENGEDGTDVCVSRCQGLVDTKLYDARDTGNYLGDTLQCRIVHATSATVDPPGHCAHADLKSNTCLADPKSEPDCDTFCHLEMAECTQANGYPAYRNEAQCKAVCNALPLGRIEHMTENTVGCRMYHAYNSVVDPKGHCSHTSPGGDGHCFTGKDSDAGNCESYCLLLKKACEDDFDASFEDQAACQADCMELDGAAANSGYTTAATGNNLQCRLLHVSDALTNPTKECAAAQGAAPCK